MGSGIMKLGTIGKNIRKYRLAKKLRQEDLAEKTGLTADVVTNGYVVKNSLLDEKLAKLTPEDRETIYDVVDVLVKHSKQILP